MSTTTEEQKKTFLVLLCTDTQILLWWCPSTSITVIRKFLCSSAPTWKRWPFGGKVGGIVSKTTDCGCFFENCLKFVMVSSVHWLTISSLYDTDLEMRRFVG